MNKIIAITGPSGSGKTTLTNLLKKEISIAIPKHITTRKPRDDDEKDFYDYINIETFIENERLNKFFFSSGDNNRYGIFIKDIQNALKNCDTVLINCSLKDIKFIKECNIPSFTIFLTFLDVEKGMCRNTKNRTWNSNEIVNRIEIFKKDLCTYEEDIRKYIDLIIYSDKEDIVDISKKVLVNLKNFIYT